MEAQSEIVLGRARLRLLGSVIWAAEPSSSRSAPNP
jgi:hypothetical protein